MPSKVWEGLRWFLPLQAVSLLSKVSTVAFLARLLERQNTLTLDTKTSIPHAVKRGQKTVRPWTNATAITGSRNERRESDEDKREFAEDIKQDWLKFDLCSQVLRVSNDLMRRASHSVAAGVASWFDGDECRPTFF